MQRSLSSTIRSESGKALSLARFSSVIRLKPSPNLKVLSWSGHSPPLSQTGQSSGWLASSISMTPFWAAMAPGELEWGHLLDLDQTHPAGANRLQLRVVAEDRDLDPDLLGRLDQQHPFRNRHLAAVDC